MGLFDKKYCDICGDKIGLLGNRKLSDGNCCKECASKLSPFFSERRQSTVDEIKDQINYRENNKEAVAAFHTTRSFGTYTKILLDEDKRQLMVTSSTNLQKANPDVIDFSQVTGCRLDIQQDRDEMKCKDAQGEEHSYNPPQYRTEYDFYVVLDINSPYFNEIKVHLNSSDDVVIEPEIQLASQPQRAAAPQGRPGAAPQAAARPGMPPQGRPGAAPQAAARPGIPPQGRPGAAPQAASRPGMPPQGKAGAAQERLGGRPAPQPQAAAPQQAPVFNQVISSRTMDPMYHAGYARFYQMGEDIKSALLGVHQEIRNEIAAENEPPHTVICPFCGAATQIKGNSGYCEFCGSSISE